MSKLKQKSLTLAIKELKDSKTRDEANTIFLKWKSAFSKDINFLIAIHEKSNRFLFEENEMFLKMESSLSYYFSKTHLDNFKYRNHHYTDCYKGILLFSDVKINISQTKKVIDKITKYTDVFFIDSRKGAVNFYLKKDNNFKKPDQFEIPYMDGFDIWTAYYYLFKDNKLEELN